MARGGAARTARAFLAAEAAEHHRNEALREAFNFYLALFSPLSQADVYALVGCKCGLKDTVVKAVVTNYLELAAAELKKNHSFTMASCFKLKLILEPEPVRISPWSKGKPTKATKRRQRVEVDIKALVRFVRMVN